MRNKLITEGKEKINSFFDTDLIKQQKNGDVEPAIKQLELALKEFDCKQFIILVVGAVKSGKSTLVNLFAHETVSPTHFLECTVRPSIISKSDKNEIIRYTLKDKSKDKVKVFESVIDYIRGIENKEDLMLCANCEYYELTKPNLEDYVELEMSQNAIDNDDTLITNITTQGGILLNKETSIIDMPGFDGRYANFKNPVYAKIANLADIVIFIQSSNSAITEVADVLFNNLKNGNEKVPIFLLYNVFDSAYWRPKKERDEQIENHLSDAKNRIKNDFGLEILDSKSINLGKVADADKYSDLEELQTEKCKFESTEQQLLEIITSNREQIHEKRCVDKIIKAINNLLTVSKNRKNNLENQKKEIKALYDKFEEFLTKIPNINIDILEIDSFLDKRKDDWISQIESVHSLHTNKPIPEKEKTDATRKRIDEFATEATKVVIDNLSSEKTQKMINGKVDDEIRNKYHNLHTEILDFFSENQINHFSLPKICISESYKFSFDGESSNIPYLSWAKKRERSEVKLLLNKTKNGFIGFSEDGKFQEGRFQLTILPELKKFYNEKVTDAHTDFSEQMYEIVANAREQKIPNYIQKNDEIDIEVKQIEQVEKDLEEIKTHFNRIQ